MIPPLNLFDLKPEHLHAFWPFIRMGLEDIKRKMGPDYIPEDVYTSIRNGHVTCTMIRRGGRDLGFVIYYRQVRPFSARPELFVWVAWNRPYPRVRNGVLISTEHRLPADGMEEVVPTAWQYLINVAKTQYGTDQISWITRPKRAKAFARKYGWEPAFSMYQVTVG